MIDGLMRDVDRLGGLDLGVWARGATPQRGPADGCGERGTGRSLTPGARLAADADGVVVVHTRRLWSGGAGRRC